MLENEKLDDLDILGDAGKPEEHAHGGKRKSLGRGLGALLGDAEFNIDEALNDTSTQPAQTPDDRVDVNLLFPSPFQPRMHPFSPATPKPCSMKLSSFPRTMISCGSDITELKSDALLYPGNLSAKTICTDDLLSSISCTLFFIVFCFILK